MERVKALNGGIAIQDRMAFQGEYFVDLYGKEAAKRTPPIYRMLDLGIPVGAGSDATRFPAITLGLPFTGWLPENHWWAFHIR